MRAQLSEIDSITHSHSTKLPGENGEDAAKDWGTRRSLKAKPYREDPRGIPTHGWENKPNPKRDHTGTEIQGRCLNRLRKREKVISIFIHLKTKPTCGTSR